MAAAKKIIDNDHIREVAESHFESFIRLVFPKQEFGGVHRELCEWMTREEAKEHQLILMPRDHGKSRFGAFYALWELTRDPAKRILYISSTSTLAEKQLGFIKDIMQSSIYRRYWPEMTHEKEDKRKKWTNTEIAVDHPKRAEEGVRDPSIMTAGLTTNIVGLHFDIVVMDDVVTGENAYTEEGRHKVARQYSFLASIEAANAREVVVGTRYHPLDLYNNLVNMRSDVFNDEGDIIDQEDVYELFERQVEDRGDGTGQFIWPRQQRGDGQWFGFDAKILATKRAKYIDKTQFYAQYYNNPNNSDDAAINRDRFQYYDKGQLKLLDGRWCYKGRKLNLIASADIAYTLSSRSDYTTIAVVGIDADRNYYILDLDRYKTKQVKEQFEHLLQLHKKWDFKKAIIEAGPAGDTIINELKNTYCRPSGIFLTIDKVNVPRNEGTKAERIKAILDSLYQNLQVWHLREGNCQILEDELVMQFPPHDDCKDAVANAISALVAPTQSHNAQGPSSNVVYLQGHSRFGGLG